MFSRQFDILAPRNLIQELDVSQGVKKLTYLPSHPELDARQVQILADIFGTSRTPEKELAITDERKEDLRALEDRVEKYIQLCISALIQASATSRPELIAEPLSDLYELIERQYEVLPKETSVFLLKQLGELELVLSLHPELPVAIEIKYLELMLQEMFQKVSKLEARTYIKEPSIQSIRQRIWKEYQTQLFTRSQHEARAFLKVSLEALKAFISKEITIFGEALERFFLYIDRLDATTSPLSAFNVDALLRREGLSAELRRLIFPACRALLEGHNQACEAYQLAGHDPQTLLDALTNGQVQAKGYIELMHVSPILAINLVFYNQEDYVAAIQTMDKDPGAEVSLKEGGRCYSANKTLHFATQALSAPLTLVSPAGARSDKWQVKNHEDDHHAMVEDLLSGMGQRRKDEKSFRLRFPNKRLTDPEGAQLQINWRAELTNQMKKAAQPIRDEVQAYLYQVETEPEWVLESLSSQDDDALYRYVGHKQYLERKRLSLQNNTGRKRDKIIEAFENDVRIATDCYETAIAEALQSARRLTSAFDDMMLPRRVTKAILRASTIDEWRYLARYLDAPSRPFRPVSQENIQSWKRWKRQQKKLQSQQP